MRIGSHRDKVKNLLFLKKERKKERKKEKKKRKKKEEEKKKQKVKRKKERKGWKLLLRYFTQIKVISYGGLLASKDKITNHVHIVTNFAF